MGASFSCGISRNVDEEADLPHPIIEGNAYQIFEKSLPFALNHAGTFAKRVRGAALLKKRR